MPQSWVAAPALVAGVVTASNVYDAVSWYSQDPSCRVVATVYAAVTFRVVENPIPAASVPVEVVASVRVRVAVVSPATAALNADVGVRVTPLSRVNGAVPNDPG